MFEPLSNRVLIKPDKAEEQTSGGIILPDTAREPSLRGEIISVGPGKRRKTGVVLPTQVEQGQVVLYAKYAGTNMEIDGEEHVLVSEADILAVVD